MSTKLIYVDVMFGGGLLCKQFLVKQLNKDVKHNRVPVKTPY